MLMTGKYFRHRQLTSAGRVVVYLKLLISFCLLNVQTLVNTLLEQQHVGKRDISLCRYKHGALMS